MSSEFSRSKSRSKSRASFAHSSAILKSPVLTYLADSAWGRSTALDASPPAATTANITATATSSPPSASSSSPFTGLVWNGRWKSGRKIGEGTFSVIYEGQDLHEKPERERQQRERERERAAAGTAATAAADSPASPAQPSTPHPSSYPYALKLNKRPDSDSLTDTAAASLSAGDGSFAYEAAVWRRVEESHHQILAASGGASGDVKDRRPAVPRLYAYESGCTVTSASSSNGNNGNTSSVGLDFSSPLWLGHVPSELLVLERCGVDMSALRKFWTAQFKEKIMLQQREIIDVEEKTESSPQPSPSPPPPPASLSSVLDSDAPLLGLEFCELGLDALQKFHEAGFVHRDIKPSNFLTTLLNEAPGGETSSGVEEEEGGENRRLRLLLTDFGLSREVSTGNTNSILHSNKDPAVAAAAEKLTSNKCVGKSMYASFTAHKNLPQSFADDIVSLLFVTLDLMYGQLPWSRAANASNVDQSKRWNDVLLEKENRVGVEICRRVCEAADAVPSPPVPPSLSWLPNLDLPLRFFRIFDHLHRVTPSNSDENANGIDTNTSNTNATTDADTSNHLNYDFIRQQLHEMRSIIETQRKEAAIAIASSGSQPPLAPARTLKQVVRQHSEAVQRLQRIREEEAREREERERRDREEDARRREEKKRLAEEAAIEAARKHAAATAAAAAAAAATRVIPQTQPASSSSSASSFPSSQQPRSGQLHYLPQQNQQSSQLPVPSAPPIPSAVPTPPQPTTFNTYAASILKQAQAQRALQQQHHQQLQFQPPSYESLPMRIRCALGELLGVHWQHSTGPNLSTGSASTLPPNALATIWSAAHWNETSKVASVGQERFCVNFRGWNGNWIELFEAMKKLHTNKLDRAVEEAKRNAKYMNMFKSNPTAVLPAAIAHFYLTSQQSMRGGSDAAQRSALAAKSSTISSLSSASTAAPPVPSSLARMKKDGGSKIEIDLSSSGKERDDPSHAATKKKFGSLSLSSSGDSQTVPKFGTKEKNRMIVSSSESSSGSGSGSDSTSTSSSESSSEDEQLIKTVIPKTKKPVVKKEDSAGGQQKKLKKLKQTTLAPSKEKKKVKEKEKDKGESKRKKKLKKKERMKKRVSDDESGEERKDESESDEEELKPKRRLKKAGKKGRRTKRIGSDEEGEEEAAAEGESELPTPESEDVVLDDDDFSSDEEAEEATFTSKTGVGTARTQEAEQIAFDNALHKMSSFLVERFEAEVPPATFKIPRRYVEKAAPRLLQVEDEEEAAADEEEEEEEELVIEKKPKKKRSRATADDEGENGDGGGGKRRKGKAAASEDAEPKRAGRKGGRKRKKDELEEEEEAEFDKESETNLSVAEAASSNVKPLREVQCTIILRPTHMTRLQMLLRQAQKDAPPSSSSSATASPAVTAAS